MTRKNMSNYKSICKFSSKTIKYDLLKIKKINIKKLITNIITLNHENASL